MRLQEVTHCYDSIMKYENGLNAYGVYCLHYIWHFTNNDRVVFEGEVISYFFHDALLADEIGPISEMKKEGIKFIKECKEGYKEIYHG